MKGNFLESLKLGQTGDICSVKKFNTSSGDVCCAGCKGLIGSIDSFFFYNKSETEVQLALKPEVAHLVFSTSRQDHMVLPKLRLVDLSSTKSCRFQKQHIACVQCDSSIGCSMKTGPNGTPVISFGIDRILLLGNIFVKSARWRNMAKDPRFSGIEHRTYNNFHGFTIEKYRVPTTTLQSSFLSWRATPT